MSRVTPRQHVLRYLAEQSANYVLMDSTKRNLEKIAEDFARDMMADPVFREQMRSEATRAARLIAESLRQLHEADAVAEARKAHSGRKRSPRKTKRRRPGTRTSRTS